MTRGTRIAAALVLIALAAGLTLRMTLFRAHLPAAERGRRLAARHGCFTCHGPGGTRGTANPGRSDLTVPNFLGDVMMYATDEEVLRQWIRDGVSEAKARSRTWRAERDAGVIRMPAFGGRLRRDEIDDLAAFVAAASKMARPETGPARRGYERASALGCFGCHGEGGRFAPPNPGSLKGYIPSWDGADYPDLVRGPAEFREWVESGVSNRFHRKPIARFFLDRGMIRMPAFRDHLEPGDVDAIRAYVAWLRGEQESPSPITAPPPARPERAAPP